MTVTFADLGLYAAGLFVLFLTPGPVWLALITRGMSGGFHAAWPLALGVVIGDALWPLLAILGVSWIVSEFNGFMTLLRFAGAAMFWFMGLNLLRHADRRISADSRLTQPGMLAGFLAGVVVILANPKAILFYMGILPGFFDLTRVTVQDITAIVLISIAVPLIGNLIFAAFIHKIRRFLTTPRAFRRTNQVAGILMLLVGCIIPFT
ncbi:LysE family translocator [Pseudoruegeria sp. SK021]|uniref:LysE family translocator n=1 Tax=Pseudoruegeria sp. SK021 TaxID=1933035 RepID=UPI000A22B71D|nr:LysE family translocator [Pseudoruegeria sp. SK021]OSP54725.1 lysine transporter LysE [Pseudoruegeria sp. SK021]